MCIRDSHISVDTGMGRGGFLPDQLEEQTVEEEEGNRFNGQLAKE